MIGFVSAGFNPPLSLTLEEIDFLENSRLILVDTYTSPNYLREFKGKELTFVDRRKLEDFEWIFKEVGNVSIVIPGDSFSATTHFAIYQGAVRERIPVKIFHNSSIFPTAATRLGLHLYKIGSPVSLPRFEAKFRPISPYEKIRENFNRGLHTILLLDTQPPMELKEALEELLWMENELKGGILETGGEVGVVSCLGTSEESIAYGRIKDLMEWRKGKIPFTIVIPSDLHFQEKESLDLFRL
ncbi:MAG: diphthine synthase [Thermoplasmatales archaeon]